MADAPTPNPIAAQDVISNALRVVSGRAGDGMAYAARAEQVIAALDAAGWEIVRKGVGVTCPACGGCGWTAEPDPSTGEPINPEPCQPCEVTGKVRALLVDRPAESHDVQF